MSGQQKSINANQIVTIADLHAFEANLKAWMKEQIDTLKSEEDPLLTTGQAAEYLGVCVQSIKRWSAKGYITNHGTVYAKRFRKSDLNKMRK